jgi:hypothetical protein
MEELWGKYNDHKESLGIFKPKRIIRFVIKPAERGTVSTSSFRRATKNIRKDAFKFSYEFECADDRCKGHTMQIIDWELYELYRHMKEKNPLDIDLALEKVKQKWFTDMWDQKRDSYLIVGSVYPRPSFVVLGVFWPPK